MRVRVNQSRSESQAMCVDYFARPVARRGVKVGSQRGNAVPSDEDVDDTARLRRKYLRTTN